jgi:hypothetical protein
MWAWLEDQAHEIIREEDLKMKMMIRSGLALGFAAVLPATSFAQGWFGECLDPMNMTPYSTPYTIQSVGTGLMQVVWGLGGTVTYGGMNGPCYGPTARTLENAGRFTFGVPGAGSVQSGFDDGLALTMGWPQDPVGNYNCVWVTGPDGSLTGAELFGSAGFVETFIGASRRYGVMVTNTAFGQVGVEIRSLADAIRFKWTLVDTAGSGGFGIVWAISPWMRSAGLDHLNSNQVNTFLPSAGGSPKFTPEGFMGYTAFDDNRPMRTEKKRELVDSNFPKVVRLLWGQTENYGMQFNTGPNASTLDHSQVSRVKVGTFGDTAGGGAPNFNLEATGTVDDNDLQLATGVNGDAGVCYLQQFLPAQTGLTGRAEIINYVRTNWSVGSYLDPYTAIVDAPKVVNYLGQAGGQDPNPMTWQLHIDNQYAEIDKEVDLVNVSAEIGLPSGLSLAPGELQTKFISRIFANQIQTLNWDVVSDGTTFGDLPVTITIRSVPGPTKVITTTVRVAANPVISFNAGPNMVSFPYQFGDSSFDRILGLTAGVDYVAYGWDGDLRAYVPTTTTQRGQGYWVIPNNSLPNQPLANANPPADQSQGGLLVNLRPGWNLIGNPYNYAVPIQQLVGVAEANNPNALTWRELVASDFVASSLTFFVPNSSLPGGGSYALTTDDTLIQPHTAYWLFVKSSQPVRLIWPPLFQEGLPNSGRSISTIAQNDREWRLQLSARSAMGADTNNYVGVVTDRNRAKVLNVPKAPEAPGSRLEMAVIADDQGQLTRMAQSISDRGGRQEFNVSVAAKDAGEVTVTWPNLPSLPRNLRVKLEDLATGEKRDLRATSGYTFRMDQAGTREFKVTVEQVGSSRPVIGNVVVAPAGRDVRNSPISINYSLSADALVTVRILSSTGKEVYTVTRGRSDSAGENTATWALKDNANRAVAPGSYKVEILAETPNGERVRKVVPVNVIR